ncbi:CHASE2 domain-containing protein [Paraburkholderia sediminicola]|uniref:CHASE2 domain-containing protein n=1 Tax=Paraburkholderia sediminicola TaxID=458836 RepID=UPI0038B78E36
MLPRLSLLSRTRCEWWLLCALLVPLAAVVGYANGLGRPDQMIYDAFMSGSPHHVPAEIVIVAIDDHSLSVLGRWPWRRSLHAALIDRIQAGHPRSIGLDLIFSEPDAVHPEDDRLLAQAISRAGDVVLPLVVNGAGPDEQLLMPLPARGAHPGHINLVLDSDGVVRSVHLFEPAPDGPSPHFGLQMLDAAGDASVRGGRATARKGPPPGDPGLFHMAYVGPAGSFAMFPYVDVLDGNVDPAVFRDRYVLVGAAATGLGDQHATPVSGGTYGMSGIEIIANVMESVRRGNGIRTDLRWLSALYSAFFVWLACLVTRRLSSCWLLQGTLLLLVALSGCSYGLARFAGIWCAPGGAFALSVLVFPIWSWRRQVAALQYLSAEARLLGSEPGLLDDDAQAGHVPSDELDACIETMRRVVRRARNLHRFVYDGLQNLPEAAILADMGYNILLANKAATLLFPWSGTGVEGGPRNVVSVLSELFAPNALELAIAQIDRASVAWVPTVGIELKDNRERNLLLRAAPVRDAVGRQIARVITAVDLTAVRQAERKREESLRFISHDMRSPQASILALLELQQDAETALPEAEFCGRIGHYVNRTLGLADDFIQLARAESKAIEFGPIDALELVDDAIEDLYGVWRRKGITISVIADRDRTLTISGERTMLLRALTNLIGNAVKYSPAGQPVTIDVSRQAHACEISVTDCGPGIPLAQQERLFTPFERMCSVGGARPDGAGLGLAYVKTVIERHDGSVHVRSEEDAGATFMVRLALASPG